MRKIRIARFFVGAVLMLAAMTPILAGQAGPDQPVRQAPSAPPAPAAPSTPAAPPAPAVPATRPAASEPPAPADPGDAADAESAGEAPVASPFPESSRPVVRVGQDYQLRAGERVREVLVVLGNATLAGEVDRDVVVVLGAVRLESTARVRGSLVAVGGIVTIDDGATVGRDLVVTAGGVDAPAAFNPGGEYVIVGLPGARQGEAVVPFFTRGLLWGRLIVPSVPWLWAVIAVVVGVYLAMNLLFDRPVRACRQVLAERPLSAFLTGLLVLVLIGPISFVLLVSLVGIPVVPFVVCGLLIAALFGKVGVTRWIGSTLVPEPDEASRLESARSFAIGTVLILLAYMVPVLGILTWAVGGMFGLGAATLAFSAGLRRESFAFRRASGNYPQAPASAGSAPAESLQQEAMDDASAAAPAPVGAGNALGAGLALLAMPKAPFLDRLAAFALDVLLVLLTYGLLDMDSGRAFFTLLLAYHVIFWGMKATTVGGIICNLRVIKTDGGPLTFADALIRGFSSIFSLAVLGLGCLWILFDAEKQAWHDRFAGTYVVKVPRNWPV